MARKRQNPLKLGKGEYQFYPEEVELMGKIPDRIIARIFDTKTMLIRQGRLERKIPASGVKDRKKIFDVLQSLNVPKSYYKAAGLADLLQPKRSKQAAVRAKHAAPKRKYKPRKPRQKYCSYISCHEGQDGKRAIASLGTDYCSLECKLSDEAYFKQPGTKTKRSPKFHVESRSLAPTPTRMPYQGYPITKPLKNPRSLLREIDQLLQAQGDQFHDDLLHSPWIAYFKFLGFIVGASAFSALTVSAISSLSEKISK